MKIATWNIERPTRHSKRLARIVECLKEVNPDILILTETNTAIKLGEQYEVFHTSSSSESYHKEGETRVSIFSKYKSTEKLNTFRSETSVCVTLQTPSGALTVYGTIIGINGNRRESFKHDLEQQLSDYNRIASSNSLCISGDLNISFSDNYYFTKEGRQKLNAAFDNLELQNLTADIKDNIDHILLPKQFMNGRNISSIETWNTDKSLSDHIGVSITLG